ncbi:MAG: DMT family transporter [Gammaproteobacteria bacterium]|nr:DMT family transporter [Gammaproteobacteria bacterium]
MTDSFKGLFAVHSAVLIFGLTALFSKLITLSALEITLLRSIFAVIIIFALFLWKRQSLFLTSFKDYRIAILLGILLALHWVTYFHAMQVSSIAVGVIALYTFPVITVFLEPLFHGEQPHIKDIVSAIVVLFGIYLLVPEFSFNNETTQGILWGVLSALLFSLRNIVQGHYFKGYSAKHSLFYQTLVTFVVLLPFSFQIVPDVTLIQWGQLLVLGIFFTALPHTLFAFSLLKLKAKTVSLIACVQVVYATIFAAIFLNEWAQISTVVGGLIVVSAAMYESYTTGRKS